MNFDATKDAIYDVLSTSTSITELLSSSWGFTAIFNRVPQENADDDSYYPFISFHAAYFSVFGDKHETGGKIKFDISVWWRGRQSSQGAMIAQAIVNELHKRDLNISGVQHVYTEMLGMAPDVIDPDGCTSRAILEFEIAYRNVN